MNTSADSRALAVEPTTAIHTTGLVRDFGRFQLGPLDLSVPVGYVTGLVGANGAGKTTLLKLLLGLQTPHSGSMDLLGARVDELDTQPARTPAWSSTRPSSCPTGPSARPGAPSHRSTPAGTPTCSTP